MRSYRLYTINPSDGSIVQMHEFAAPDDETAVYVAEGLRHSRPMELHTGRRRVRRWEQIEGAREGETVPIPRPTIPLR